jgi:excisionase family DNA binding protein
VTGFTTARQEQVERAGASGETRRSVERLALSKAEAAEALGVSVDFLEEHVMGELRIVRRGRRRLIPLSELQRWLDESSARTLSQ